MNMVSQLVEVSPAYDVILCDVWGVLHNGQSAWASASAALAAAREGGKTIVLITNSPRPAPGVRAQLGLLGVPEEAWDAIATSGDVTRTLMANAPRRQFHLGPDRDLSLFDGLDIDLVDEFEADAIVCTGLYDDETETPEDYEEMLARFRGRDLPFICANPDIVVERGDRLVYCAGALARRYALMGGRTLIAGKPHEPIYDLALKLAAEARGAQTPKEKVLVIGDGITTDVKGAMDNGFDLVFITDGIHAREYGEHGRPDQAQLAKFLSDFGAEPVALMTKLA
ncbi:MAG: TIGR01459 family HAD-type hydrolase [Pseudomonadota bacterium]